MVSPRLIQQIELNWERIATQVIEQVRTDARVAHYHHLPAQDIRDRARDLVNNLGHWLTSRNEDELARRYESLGVRRCREGIPISEVLYKINLLKTKIGQYARETYPSSDAVSIYGELELVRAVTVFFDLVTLSVARGYDLAMAADARPATDDADAVTEAVA